MKSESLTRWGNDRQTASSSQVNLLFRLLVNKLNEGELHDGSLLNRWFLSLASPKHAPGLALRLFFGRLWYWTVGGIEEWLILFARHDQSCTVRVFLGWWNTVDTPYLCPEHQPRKKDCHDGKKECEFEKSSEECQHIHYGNIFVR